MINPTSKRCRRVLARRKGRGARRIAREALLAIMLGLALLMAIVAGCTRKPGEGAAAKGEHGGHGEGVGHAEHAGEQEEARGPHGGRLFTYEGGRLELRIFEAGVPPEFHAYFFDAAGKPVMPSGERLVVLLDRFGGRRDSIAFEVDGDRLRGTRTVEEPHSYHATVRLARAGAAQTWDYEQQEGRVELAPEAVAGSGIRIGEAGPASIAVTVDTPGEVRLNAERLTYVRPRYAGVVRQLPFRLGQHVRRGDVVARVQSSESLTEYEITSEMAGMIVAREASVGQVVNEETTLYTIADLSTVWVDFAIYPQNAGRIRAGQTVRIISQGDSTRRIQATISFVGPLLEEDTRTTYARAVIANADRGWQPGLFVIATVTLETPRVAVAVPEAAIVRTERGPAVFRARGSSFELQPVEVGRTDGTTTEITAGLEAGAAIVIEDVFLLKAELGKSEAAHDH